MAFTTQPLLLAALMGICAILISIASLLVTTIRTVITPDTRAVRLVVKPGREPPGEARPRPRQAREI